MAIRYPVGDDQQLEAALAAATEAIRGGTLVVLPTDTVYGVAADAFDPDAVAGLLAAKGRGREMPPPVLIGASATLDALATRLTDVVRALADEFWPGPLTLVCHQQASLRWDLGETRGTVAVRMPDHPVALAVLERTGPLAVSSANLSGHPAATTADAADEMLGDAVEVIVDDGPSPGGVASTILDVTSDTVRVLRAGAIGSEEINGVLARFDIRLDDEADPGAPGA
ncbi:L-threonylcarbamoyladenylate synthase [Nocardioides limicola]|uniref:L-threonylcarbamoyladenylate synthase n=1 Tax=Nocardioides limicola TaxID=2803368 RepID=UPI00193AF728|nr:L-threonylcarbamoyladenylate synthase [Nocardioides sp. DJM-14]